MYVYTKLPRIVVVCNFLSSSFILQRVISSPLTIYISSNCQRCSVKKGVLKNFAKFTGKHLCQSLFFIKVAALGLQLY